MLPQLEGLMDGHPGSGHLRICLSPRSQVFFRPEEIQGRSEGIAGTALILRPFPDPHHHVAGVGVGARRIDGYRYRLAAVVTLGPDADCRPQHRRDPQRVDRTAHIALSAAFSEIDPERGRGHRERVGEIHAPGFDAKQVLLGPAWPAPRRRFPESGSGRPTRCDRVPRDQDAPRRLAARIAEAPSRARPAGRLRVLPRPARSTPLPF